ncbi:unnamed protein product [Linum tenue]|nr:unnamed protein product [Linum tenue]
MSHLRRGSSSADELPGHNVSNHGVQSSRRDRDPESRPEIRRLKLRRPAAGSPDGEIADERSPRQRCYVRRGGGSAEVGEVSGEGGVDGGGFRCEAGDQPERGGGYGVDVTDRVGLGAEGPKMWPTMDEVVRLIEETI